jgi:hypothetical protein
MGCPPKPHAPVLALRRKKQADEYTRFNDLPETWVLKRRAENQG